MLGFFIFVTIFVMKKVFIDTNIYLNFFRRADSPISYLDKLYALIERGEIEVVFTRQVHDEFYRDVDVVKHQTIERLETYKKGSGKEIKIPHLLRGVVDQKGIVKYYDAIHNKIDKAIDSYKKKVDNPRSQINIKLKKIMDESKIVEHSRGLLLKAYYRTLKGNPPRKNDHSFGDAINWECFLENFADDELVIISGDGDFESFSHKGKIDDFLKHEWEECSDQPLSFYTTLGEFINAAYKEDVVEEEEIEIEEEIGQELKVAKGIDYAVESDEGISYMRKSPVFSNNIIVGDNSIGTSAVATDGISWFGQRTCEKCGKILDGINSFSTDPLCQECKSLSLFKRHCIYCGKEIDDFSTSMICGDCSKSPLGSGWGGVDGVQFK